MAKQPMKCTLVKKSALRGTKKPMQATAAGPVVEFVAQDNEDSTYTIFGVDSAGNQVDISAIATLAMTGGQAPSVTFDAPVGMTVLFHFAAPPTTAPVICTATVAWNDGSQGPYVIDQPVSVISSGTVIGIEGIFGPPVIR